MDGLLYTLIYVTVTAHFISDDWEIKNYVLKTEELREKHTAENVSECILQILGEFEIKLESVKVLSKLTMEQSKSECADVVKQPDARKNTAMSAMGNLFGGVYSQTQSSAEGGIRALEHEMDMYE